MLSVEKTKPDIFEIFEEKDRLGLPYGKEKSQKQVFIDEHEYLKFKFFDRMMRTNRGIRF